MERIDLLKIDNIHLYEFTLSSGEVFTGILEQLAATDKYYLIKPYDISSLNEATKERPYDMETLNKIRREVQLKDIKEWKQL